MAALQSPHPAKAEAKMIHLHFMQSALALARRAPKLPTNFRVGAVLVDSRRLPAGVLATLSDHCPRLESVLEGGSEDGCTKGQDGTATSTTATGTTTTTAAAAGVAGAAKFDCDTAILATGYTGELPGNTHAEECALEKYGRECRGDGVDNDDDDDDDSLDGGDELAFSAMDDNLGPAEMYATSTIDDDVDVGSAAAAAATATATATTSPANFRPRRLSISSTGADGSLPLAPTKSPVAPDLLLYTTLEPCSLRLSGREPCVSRIIRARFDDVAAAEAATPTTATTTATTTPGPVDFDMPSPVGTRTGRRRRSSRLSMSAVDGPNPDPVGMGVGVVPSLSDVGGGVMGTSEGLYGLRHRRRPARLPQRQITHVFVGTVEPPAFVKENPGRETLVEEGVQYVVVPGLEEQIMKVASAGHQADEKA